MLDVVERFPVVAVRGIFISKDGRVWKNAKELKVCLRNGYKSVSINGKYEYVHRLMAEVFLGPGAGVVDHINRDKLANYPDNLRWTSRKKNSENIGPIEKAKQRANGKRQGLANKGENNGQCILSDSVVNILLQEFKDNPNLNRTQRAKELNVSRSLISMILNGKRRNK